MSSSSSTGSCSSTAPVCDGCGVAAVRDGCAMRVKDAVGRFGEQVAVDWLSSAGMVVLERNWRCPDGEIDIVAVDGDTLVVVEVKTRSSLAFGAPAEAVGRAKAARLRRLAVRWLEQHPERFWADLRFDVVAVVRQSSGGPSVEHFPAAF